MKKILLIFMLMLAVSGCLYASVNARVAISNEISDVDYNRIWVSPTKYYYSVETITFNPMVESNFDIMLTKNFGFSLGTGFGYQFGFYDFNRFVTMPDSLNANVSIGLVGIFNGFRVSLSGAGRSLFQTARNSWVSQVGGILDLSYIFSNGISLIGKFTFLTSYKMRTMGLSFGVGYSFGGNR